MKKLTDAVWSKIRSPFSRENTSEPSTLTDDRQSFELFSAEQRELHGRSLAERHRLGSHSLKGRLLEQLDDNAQVLAEVYAQLVEDLVSENKITAAGEWLLDNYYLMEDQIQTARRHLPRRFSRELPRLANGNHRGLPRVYDLAMETIYHCDGRIDTDCLGGILKAYQSVTPLKLGELWAIPIMLRLALIENLSRVATRIADSRRERLTANLWARKISLTMGHDPRALIHLLSDMNRAVPSPSCSFIAELTSRLQTAGGRGNMPLPWLEQCLPEEGLSIEDFVRQESQRQAANQVSISNCISSLRAINAIDWRAFVEEMSLVEQTLRQDPAGVYPQMNFTTRDRYRHVVEKMARHTKGTEADLTRAALELAERSAQRLGPEELASHVGYYLLGGGKAELEKEAGVRVKIVRRLIQTVRRQRLPLYLGAIFSLTLILTLVFTIQAFRDGAGFPALILIALFSVFGSAHLSIALTDWLATLLVPPKALPRMDFSDGLPESGRSLVVVPSMLYSKDNAAKLFSDLEVRFLANQDPRLHFALLTDFTDSNTETKPEDEALLQEARDLVDRLNQKYPRSEGSAFYLFHRPRRWNPSEKKWMGEERKRGKLEDLNDLLATGRETAFSLIRGDRKVLSAIKYVITLDTDTRLTRDSARKFIGAMAHPLNRPVYDPARHLVTSGYGLLQPRVGDSLSIGGASRYASLCVIEAGLDQYTQTSSNVYQDLFGQGSFIGKGIYDLAVFRKVLGGRFPDNRILSHDLLEGCYVRGGYLSDVPLYEDYPAQYSSDMARRHRWIRGDWQIAGWLGSRVPGRDGTEPNPLSALSRWKIFDNLRRSLTAAALTLLMLTGWVATRNPWCWTLAVLGVILIPSVLASAISAFQKPQGLRLGQYLISLLRLTPRRLSRAAFSLVTLPHTAYYSLDAIFRSLWRLNVSKTRRLEWQSSQATEKNAPKTWFGYWRSMWFSPVLAVAIVFLLDFLSPGAIPAAAPILFLWFIAPGLCWWLSRSAERRETPLTSRQSIFLRRLARRTWHFFETYVTAEDHWLPPDNFQEYPQPKLAHRTSPTNIGLSLLANLSAFDFGYQTADGLIDRTSKTMATLKMMERHRGHFYNWYDTRTLAPLSPRYISSVDSGNLVGHLLTLKSGLAELPDQPFLGPNFFSGLGEALELALEAALKLEDEDRSASFKPLKGMLTQTLKSTPTTLSGRRERLEKLHDLALSLNREPTPQDPPEEHRHHHWLQVFIRQCRDGLNDLILFAPWSGNSPEPEATGLAELDRVATWSEIAALEDRLQTTLDRFQAQTLDPEEKTRRETLAGFVAAGSRKARQRLEAVKNLLEACEELSDVEYDFLFDEARQLLTIGYNVDEVRRDNSYYDLLASEARLATFVGIAQGRLPQAGWFALGRLFYVKGRRQVLLSWSGSMFEYLMPLLVMPNFEQTLLAETYRAAVDSQIEYGREQKVPWGVSESGYSMVDAQYNYQYRAFGVPELGLRRVLSDDLVIAPYASALALMVDRGLAARNLDGLWSGGLAGEFGFYEAADYTPSRLVRGQSRNVVRSYMAHHQGMTLAALANTLLGNTLQKRFRAEPRFQATMMLLQERVPEFPVSTVHSATHPDFTGNFTSSEETFRVYKNGQSPHPEIQLLSNGRYHVMVSNAGGGYSRWKELALTRWREDATLDNWGSFCYLRDTAAGDFWSVTPQPCGRQNREYETVFTEGRAEFHTRDHNYDVRTDIVVSSEDDVEIRRIKITNRSRGVSRTLELTTMAEVVLASAKDDDAHPAFSKLFVQTEITPAAVYAHRKSKDEGQETLWMFHTLAVHGAEAGLSFETDRLNFIGRGGTAAAPAALIQDPGPLTGRDGWVLDPVLAARCQVTIPPETTVIVDLLTGVAPSREEAAALADKYGDRYIADRVFDMAWTHGQAILSHMNATEAEAQLYNRLAGSVVYAGPELRAAPDVLAKNRRGQAGLWGYSVSGDYPIVLLRMEESGNLELVRQLLAAHAYWRLKGLTVDLVIWYEDQGGYRQELYDSIMSLISGGLESGWNERPGGVFIRMVEHMVEEDLILFQTAARVVLRDTWGPLSEQVDRPGRPQAKGTPLLPEARPVSDHRSGPRPKARANLIFDNGWGGFSQDGREYIITTSWEHQTPLPWVNVLANPGFGTVISESGLAYTWSENAHEFRLTPWGNDPVGDSVGELFYIRDEDSGIYWSPMPQPCPGRAPYVTRHGFGYSVFEHAEENIQSEMSVYVDLSRPVKYMSLTLKNTSAQVRSLSVTGYVEWVLGDQRAGTGPFIITETSPEGIILAQNTYSSDFPERAAFFDVDAPERSLTGNRLEFLGRNGRREEPAALKQTRLSGWTGAGLDPCGALQVKLELQPGQERKLIFRLGAGLNRDQALSLARETRGPKAAFEALGQVENFWAKTLNTIEVQTPDLSFDLLANGWLIYQTLACRLWGRSSLYQSGGAFGFRDQLQDCLALLHSHPELVREHILTCAAHQFQEGDVQHWWHPPTGRGVRTSCSDDYLWLPLVTARYVQTTGDESLLDEEVPFLEGRALKEGEESNYDLPTVTPETAPLYEHCRQAIWHGLKFGSHRLPLIGSGDWNDGLDRVGLEGRGESVWLGFFLHLVLTEFGRLAAGRGDQASVNRFRDETAALRLSLDEHGWDGQWYRRAYFDDGTPLGSSANEEGRIDAVAQSWAVLSGAGEVSRTRRAMAALKENLVDQRNGLIRLLIPPFDQARPNPGYIKNYPPGVRENGGQYTHAAVWAVMAFAALGDRANAWDLFHLINPINHGRAASEAETYLAEPYVVAADVYSVPPHAGRGGWSWYTGSSAWMYQLMIESLLGLKVEADHLIINPCPPEGWPEYRVSYRYRETVYHLHYLLDPHPEAQPQIKLDHKVQEGLSIPLTDDRVDHEVEIRWPVG